MDVVGFTNLSIGWNNDDIRSFTKGLRARGGGDIPEVGIYILFEVVRIFIMSLRHAKLPLWQLLRKLTLSVRPSSSGTQMQVCFLFPPSPQTLL